MFIVSDQVQDVSTCCCCGIEQFALTSLEKLFGTFCLHKRVEYCDSRVLSVFRNFSINLLKSLDGVTEALAGDGGRCGAGFLCVNWGIDWDVRWVLSCAFTPPCVSSFAVASKQKTQTNLLT